MLVKSQVKYIQSLGHKKFRSDAAEFIAEGPKIINELLHDQHVQLVQLFALRQWTLSNEPLVKSLPSKRIEIITEADLKRISFLSAPNEVLGIFSQPIFQPMDCSHRITLVLDGIQDPGNVGTIIRMADWFGTQQIFCSENTADIFSPKVVQATMGSICRVQVLYGNIENFLQAHKKIPTYGAFLDGQDVRSCKKIGEAFVVIGNESQGISGPVAAHVQLKITIPRRGEAESLNAAVAAGIVLSHLVA